MQQVKGWYQSAPNGSLTGLLARISACTGTGDGTGIENGHFREIYLFIASGRVSVGSESGI